MYKHFYNLQRNPFNITPDPSFLFATKQHNEALAAIYYGVVRRKGFVVLTGEVGTGKTLLVRCLLQLLSNGDVAYAYVFNPRLSPMEFLQYVAGDFGLPTAGKSKAQLLLDLCHLVIGRFRNGLTTVLVVDEAHHLSAEVLEEVRLLTNLEAPQEKLLQIVLVGQEELDEQLDSVNLRQLKQRVALRAQLHPLDLNDTRGYMHRRLELAGSRNPDQLFPIETVVEVHARSRGYPRLINTLCENALIHGYGQQSPSIPPEIIAEVAGELRLGTQHPSIAELRGERESLQKVQQAARTLLDLCAHLRAEQHSNVTDELEQIKT
jgi:general secretion pathway protein A